MKDAYHALAANGGGPSRLQSARLVTAGAGSLGVTEHIYEYH